MALGKQAAEAEVAENLLREIMGGRIRATNLIICRHIELDGRLSANLYGIGNSFSTTEFPVTIPQICVWVGTEEHSPAGDNFTAVAITRDDDQVPICEPVIFKSDVYFKRGTGSLEAYFRDVTFEAPGVFRVRVLDGTVGQLISRQFVVKLATFDELSVGTPADQITRPS